MMMLPRLKSLPREGFVFIIASEAYLTARKQLVVESGRALYFIHDDTHESVFILRVRMNASAVTSCNALVVAMPA